MDLQQDSKLGSEAPLCLSTAPLLACCNLPLGFVTSPTASLHLPEGLASGQQ